jgi:hypothetical protein
MSRCFCCQNNNNYNYTTRRTKSRPAALRDIYFVVSLPILMDGNAIALILESLSHASSAPKRGETNDSPANRLGFLERHGRPAGRT